MEVVPQKLEVVPWLGAQKLQAVMPSAGVLLPNPSMMLWRVARRGPPQDRYRGE